MNNLTQKEINGQLFHLSKEAVKTLVLESKCGLVSSVRDYKRNSSSIDINTLGNFSPLLCIYKRSSPNYIHSKNSNGFDEDTFKKEILPATNALMTLNILELVDYYRKFKNIDRATYSLSEIYQRLAKDQINFYSINLRDAEGVFVEKKNISENNYKHFSLIDKNKKFKFSDQAFMMVVYYKYSCMFPEDKLADEYKKFSLEILDMFLDFKEKLYTCSFEELCKIVTAMNIFYKHSKNEDTKILIIDLVDFLINKFDEKDYYVENLDFTSLFAINLMLAYKHTKIINFREKTTEIMNKLITLYDEDKGIFLKISGKKEIKYSCFDVTFYFLALNMHAIENNKYNEYKHILSSIYRKYFINSGLIPSWPEAPTLDDYERYRGLTLNSKDMLDENFFKVPNISSPKSTGVAPIFHRTITYSKKKDSFTVSSSSFDSYKNMFIYQMFILLFKDDFLNETKLDNIDTSKPTDNIVIASENKSIPAFDNLASHTQNVGVNSLINFEGNDADNHLTGILEKNTNSEQNSFEKE